MTFEKPRRTQILLPLVKSTKVFISPASAAEHWVSEHCFNGWRASNPNILKIYYLTLSAQNKTLKPASIETKSAFPGIEKEKPSKQHVFRKLLDLEAPRQGKEAFSVFFLWVVLTYGGEAFRSRRFPTSAKCHLLVLTLINFRRRIAYWRARLTRCVSDERGHL